MTEALFNRAQNKNDSYLVMVFDLLVCNIDRHADNLLARRSDLDAEGPIQIVANDHSHCMVLPRRDVSSLAALKDAIDPRYAGSMNYVKNSIENVEQLDKAIDRVEAVGDRGISDLIDGIPEELLSGTDKMAYIELLVYRKTFIRRIFDDHRSFFPRLQPSAP